MTPERWQQIDQLFHEALACEADQRGKFLATQCAGDEALHREVESLLSSLEESSDFIETPAGDVAAELLDSHQSTLDPGHQIENYRIICLLGSGGMGDVYLAEDVRLKRKVALKLLPPHFMVNPDRVRRFEREARAASALNHPNIVTIYEIGQSDSAHFIATEFVDGKTLRQMISEKPLKLSETLNVAIQVAGALVGAHTAGIIHRDIKPENIMIRSDGYVKILDFGLAKLTEQQEVSEVETETPTLLQSNPGLVMGTVQYMSPEQARGKHVDARTDVWSLGIVLYELLAGRVPFTGETPSHVMVSLMENELPPLTEYVNAPDDLDRIVTKALQKNKRERYQTAGQLLQDLKKFKQELQVEAHLQRFFEPAKSSPTQPPVARAVGRTTSPVNATRTRSVSAMSSAEYLVHQVGRHKRAVAVAAALLLTAVLATRYVYFNRRPTVRSIAVLPFKNTSNNADLEYLSDGLSESLTNSLSPVPGLTVRARASSFKYKGKEVDPQEVAKNLGVDAIVTGRIAQLADNFLINVELVDAHTGKQIWGKQYTSKASDLVAMQSEMTREITRELRLHLTNAEQQQLTQARAVNPQAYDLYLKGRDLWRKGGDKNTQKAIEYYQEAIAVDPGYALVYAELAGSYSALITNDVLPQKEFGPKADGAALKAVELDDNLAEAHLALAGRKIDAWDWAAAEREIKRALELNPNLVPAHGLYGVYHVIHGRRVEAVAEMSRVRELDPLAMSASQERVNMMSIFRQNAEAIELQKKIVELNKSHPGPHERLGTLYVRVGQYREAIAEYQEAIRLGKTNAGTQIALAAAYAHMGDRDKAREIIEPYESGKEYLSPVSLAWVYVALGDRDKTFAALERAYAVHDQTLIWLRSEWEFDVLHDDPRFHDLVRRIGLDS